MDAAGLSISLAGIVLKLVIFSLDFVGDAKQVYKQGATDRNVDLSTVTKSVEDATTTLIEQLDAFGDNQVLSADDEQLKELSLRTAEIGRELAQRLGRVTADDTSKWKSFKAAALSMWEAGEIEKTEKRLNAIKDQVQLRILVGIREKVNLSHDTDNSRILSTLEEVAKQHAGSKEDTRRMIEKLNEADKISRWHHDELVGLGNQIFNSINAMQISRSSAFVPIHQASSGAHDDTTRKEAERCILNSLWYPSIYHRVETISGSYSNTFQWIFESPETTGKPWDSFVDFLTGNMSTYWITGKPGCGKSTLMKFITDNPKTEAHLKQWAGERELIRASFYFYYHGREYQKSEIGMIRSLLYSILQQRRDLISSTFKNRYQDAIEGRKFDDLPLPEAQRALVDLIAHNLNLCLFISIDGLDEFDPAVSRTRVQNLIDFTHALEKFSNVKILVSSRPLAEFELGYDGRPSLSVHHLTQEDIRRYAYERLMKHPRMNTLAKKEQTNMSDLLHSIVELSLGVFLWVRLVTALLEDGLTNHESIDDLKKRVNDLPPDLEDLYRTMLGRIDHRYRSQSARLLSFVRYIHSHKNELTLLDLWYAENADDNMVCNTPVEPIEEEKVRDRSQQLETLLKYRCMGLIETAKPSTVPIGSTTFGLRENSEFDATARFLHRSVYEFFGRRGVWNEFVQKYLSPTFSVGLCLFRSAILLIKGYRLLPKDSQTYETIAYNVGPVGDRARLAELETKQSHAHPISELDLAMRGVMPLVYLSHQAELANYPDIMPGKAMIPNPTRHWSVECRNLRIMRRHSFWPLQDSDHGSLMTFAVESGLTFYIQKELNREGRKVWAKSGLPLLGYALMVPFHAEKVGTVKFLLDEGHDPNEIYNGMTLWEWFLWIEMDRPTILDAIPTIEAALLAGANPNGKVLWGRSKLHSAERIKSRGLSWYPPSFDDNSTSIGTILTALIRTHQSLKDDFRHAYDYDAGSIDQNDETIQRVIKYLEEHGAVEKEWKDSESMRGILFGICGRIDKAVNAASELEMSWYKRLVRRLKRNITPR